MSAHEVYVHSKHWMTWPLIFHRQIMIISVKQGKIWVGVLPDFRYFLSINYTKEQKNHSRIIFHLNFLLLYSSTVLTYVHYTLEAFIEKHLFRFHVRFLVDVLYLFCNQNVEFLVSNFV